jgi:hypothetical protein
MQRTILRAMEERAPALYASLKASGELKKVVEDLEQEICSTAGQLTLEQRVREGWDKLGPLECAARMRAADHLNREAALAQALEFPQDETSPPSPDGTTGAPTTT